MLKCKTCGGEYEPAPAGGAKYFHACPPIDRATIDRLGVVSDVDASTVKAGDKLIKQFAIDRPNHRDENVIVIGYDKTGNPIGDIKAAGAGVDKL